MALNGLICAEMPMKKLVTHSLLPPESCIDVFNGSIEVYGTERVVVVAVVVIISALVLKCMVQRGWWWWQ